MQEGETHAKSVKRSGKLWRLQLLLNPPVHQVFENIEKEVQSNISWKFKDAWKSNKYSRKLTNSEIQTTSAPEINPVVTIATFKLKVFLNIFLKTDIQ